MGSLESILIEVVGRSSRQSRTIGSILRDGEPLQMEAGSRLSNTGAELGAQLRSEPSNGPGDDSTGAACRQKHGYRVDRIVLYSSSLS